MSVSDGRYEDNPVINRLMESAQLLNMKVSYVYYQNMILSYTFTSPPLHPLPRAMESR
jgi:hypothetical protein